MNYNLMNKTDCAAYAFTVVIENAPDLEFVDALRKMYDKYNVMYSGATSRGLMSLIAEENKCVYRLDGQRVIFTYVGI